MAWIDHNNVYDMVPHSWIRECLELFGVAEDIKTLLVNSMEKWRVMCAGYSEYREVDIKQGVFQADSLSPSVFLLARRFFISFSVSFSIDSIKFDFKKGQGIKEKINHLLFMDDLKLYSCNEEGSDTLVQTIRVFSEVIGMEFGIAAPKITAGQRSLTVTTAFVTAEKLRRTVTMIANT